MFEHYSPGFLNVATDNILRNPNLVVTLLWSNVSVEARNSGEKLGVQDLGGCQNWGPFLGPYYNTTPNI